MSPGPAPHAGTRPTERVPFGPTRSASPHTTPHTTPHATPHTTTHATPHTTTQTATTAEVGP
jgi:serine/threonine-protein kinase PknK